MIKEKRIKENDIVIVKELRQRARVLIVRGGCCLLALNMRNIYDCQEWYSLRDVVGV